MCRQRLIVASSRSKLIVARAQLIVARHLPYIGKALLFASPLELQDDIDHTLDAGIGEAAWASVSRGSSRH
jgi:hypothetical protein